MIPDEQGQVLQVFVLASILDGHFSGAEKKLYRELVDTCDAGFECRASASNLTACVTSIFF